MTDLRLKLSDADRERVRILFLAKHALSDGAHDPIDGGHASYHHELRTVLEGLDLNLDIRNSYDGLFPAPDYDYLFTLLNRGGFKNSEMFAPLFAHWRQIPHLGASPILRGVGDDKYLMKLCAERRGVKTPKFEIYRRMNPDMTPPKFDAERWVIKPNASSASWGVRMFDDYASGANHMNWLFGAEGGYHDVLVEEYFDGVELAVPVVGGRNGEPVYLPTMIFVSDGDNRIRTYEQKRGFAAPASEGFTPFDDKALAEKARAETEKLMKDIWPFDYGRFEFKLNPTTGEISFIEVNMSCNLWSTKTLSLSWQSLGYDHSELVETILTSSLLRQGVIEAPA